MEYRRYCTEGEKGEKGGWEENGDGKGGRLMGGSFVHPLYPRIAALLCLRAWVWQGLLQPACIGLGRSALFAVAGKLPARLDPTSPSASLSPACPALTSKLFMQLEPPHRLLTLHPPPPPYPAVASKLFMLLAPFLKRWTYSRTPEQVRVVVGGRREKRRKMGLTYAAAIPLCR